MSLTILQKYPGRKKSIHEVVQLCKVPYDKVFTSENVISGFQQAEIVPKNPKIFPITAFLIAKPTDLPILFLPEIIIIKKKFNNSKFQSLTRRNPVQNKLTRRGLPGRNINNNIFPG